MRHQEAFFAAFGGALLLFAAIATIPLLSTSNRSSTALSQTEIGGNWAVDYEASEIRFSGIYDGGAFSGTFEDWNAEITFDPDALADASADITISSTDARTGKKLYDDSLIAAEWFNASVHPQISVKIEQIVKTEIGFAATAHVTLKDTVISTPFTFELNFDGDTANMTGRAELSRAVLNLGQVSDPAADWVSDKIDVTVKLRATRI